MFKMKEPKAKFRVGYIVTHDDYPGRNFKITDKMQDYNGNWRYDLVNVLNPAVVTSYVREKNLNKR